MQPTTHEEKAEGDRSLDERFVEALTASQAPLLAYITCLLGNVDDASTVLQETNLVLWRKSSEFAQVRSFLAWARGVAYFQALAFLRDRKRDKLIFSQDAIDSLVAERDIVELEERRLALRDCLSQLQGSKRELIQKRYVEGKRIGLIAKELKLSDGAVTVSLSRIRLILMNCINQKLRTTK